MTYETYAKAHTHQLRISMLKDAHSYVNGGIDQIFDDLGNGFEVHGDLELSLREQVNEYFERLIEEEKKAFEAI